MYKICLSVLLLILSSSRIAAEEPVSSFVIYLMDGTNLTCLLSDKPTIKFSTTDLIVSSDNASFTIPLNNLNKFGFESKSSSISVIEPEKINYTVFENRIIINNLAMGAPVKIINIDGKSVFERVNRDERGDMEISIGAFTPGVYLLNINSSTAKFVIK